MEQRERTYLTFKLGEEEYGLDISRVLSIIKTPDIVGIPKSPKFVEGLVNVRGEVVTVVDLREKFGLSPERGENLIVVELDGRKFALMVDKANQILHADEKNLKKSLPEGVEGKYIDKAVIFGKKVIVILDLTQLLGVKPIKKYGFAKI